MFAEPRAEDVVRVLAEGEAALPVDEALTVSFPLNLPKHLLERRFKALLAEHHKGQRGKQYAKMSKTKYEGSQDIPALELGLDIVLALFLELAQQNRKRILCNLGRWPESNKVPMALAMLA